MAPSRALAAALAATGALLVVTWKRAKQARLQASRRILKGWSEVQQKDPQGLPSAQRVPVVDLRSDVDFVQRRLVGSCGIPAEILWTEDWWFSLPDKKQPFVLLLPRREWRALYAKLLLARPDAAGNLLLLDTPELWQAADEQGLLISGAVSPQERREGLFFEPCPFLARIVSGLEEVLLATAREGEQEVEEEHPTQQYRLKARQTPLTCLDVGCGSGRDVAYLACRGWTVTGVDCWSRVLDRTRRLAERAGVKERVETWQGKVTPSGTLQLAAEHGRGVRTLGISKQQQQQQQQQQQREQEEGSQREEEPPVFALVMVVRYLNRASFDTLESLVRKPGGYLLHYTFQEEEQGEPWPHHSPKNMKMVLKVGELRERFGPSRGWEVLVDTVTRLPDGRPMNCFLARTVASD